MRSLLFVFILVLSLRASAYGQEGSRRPMTVDDAFKMVSLGDVLMSPDGAWVFYTTRTVNWETNTYDLEHFMVSSQGGTPRRFVGKAGGSDFQFSPDGAYLSFKRTVEGVSQIFLLPTDGGEAFQLTTHANAVGAYEWAADGTQVFFLAEEPRSPEAQKAFELGADVVYVNEGPTSKRHGQWDNLWAIQVASKQERRLSQEELHIQEFEAAPDGSTVLFVARASSDENDIDHNELYLLDTATGAVRQVTDNRAVEDALQWAPDGSRFAFKADDDQAWTAKRDRLWVVDLADGTPRLVSGAFTVGRINTYFWSPDGRFLRFNALQQTEHNFFELDLEGGAIRPLTTVKGNLVVRDLSADHARMVYTFDDHDTPPDLYTMVLGGETPVRLTHLNDWIEEEIALASMEVVQWESVKGFDIEGLLHLPPNPAPGTHHPLILHIHGGPPGFWWNTFSPRHQILAGLGYASLSPNIRGSDGYTDELREGNTFYRGDGIGQGDFEDLMAGLDYVIREGWADPERLGVRGWSYGAILGGYALTKTDRFKAASLGAGVYDWLAEFSLGYHWDVTRWYIGGTPWTNREAWLEQSTLTHVENITTPLLLHHGMEDHTTTEPQSMLLYGAMRALGKAPVRFLRYPREPHGFREPQHQKIQLVEEIQWMEQYLRF